MTSRNQINRNTAFETLFSSKLVCNYILTLWPVKRTLFSFMSGLEKLVNSRNLMITDYITFSKPVNAYEILCASKEQ